MKRIYIVADLEGASGIYLAKQCDVAGEDWQVSRKSVTTDVNGVISGVFSAGVEEVVVCDFHNRGILVMDMLDDRAIVEASDHHVLMPGLTEDFSGLIIVGAHAMAGAADAFQDHTMHSDTWFSYRLGGTECGEIGILAAYAGHFGVPLLMVSGDAAACREAESVSNNVIALGTKEAVSRDVARTSTTRNMAKWIGEASERAVTECNKSEPLMVDLPEQVEVEYNRTDYADQPARYEGAERVDARTVRREIGSTLDLLKGF